MKSALQWIWQERSGIALMMIPIGALAFAIAWLAAMLYAFRHVI